MGNDSNKDPGEPPTPIDYSPASGAVDPAHAAQDQSEPIKTDRHSYTENATYIGGELDAPSNNEVTWAEDGSDGTRWATLNEANRDFVAGQYDDESDDHIEQRRRTQDRRRDAAMWGHKIGLSGPEIDASIEMMEALDQDIRRHHGDDATVLAALTLAANKQAINGVKSIRDNGITTGHDGLVERYSAIRDTLDVATATVETLRQHIHESTS